MGYATVVTEIVCLKSRCQLMNGHVDMRLENM